MVALQPAATHIAARVGIDRGPWTDIIIDGTDDDARWFCRKLVDRELEEGAALDKRVMRDCTDAALPAPPRSRVQLVILEPIGFEDLLIPGLLERTPGASSPKGTLLRVAPFTDRAGCEAMLVRLEADEQRQRMDSQQAVAKFLDEQIARVDRELEPTCKQADEAAQRCAKLRDDARGLCEIELDRHKRLCEYHRFQRAELEARRTQPPPPSRLQRSCRVP